MLDLPLIAHSGDWPRARGADVSAVFVVKGDGVVSCLPNGENLGIHTRLHSGGVNASWAWSSPLFGVQPIGGECPSWMGATARAHRMGAH